MALENEPLYAYCHMGKVGGKNFLKYCRSHFGASYIDAIAKQGSIYQNEDLKTDLERFPKLRSIGGHHVRPHINFSCTQRPFIWYTILREPIERSLCHYQQQHHSSGKYRIPYVEWLQKFRRGRWQVNMLVGPDGTADDAIEVLKTRFQIVGLNDRYEETMLMMKRLIGMSVNIADGRKKTPPEKKVFDVQLRQKIQPQMEEILQLLSEDIKLYQYGTDIRFAQQLEAYGSQQMELDLATVYNNDCFNPNRFNMFMNDVTKAKYRFFKRLF